MNEVFRKECEELGINYDTEFPFHFAPASVIEISVIADAQMWILKRRQDKMLAEALMGV